jgi:hypothetical protein
MDMRKRGVWQVIVVAGLVWLGCAAPASADTTVTARLQAINRSGVRGTASITANDDGSLTVVIHGTGFVPGVPHAQHIHGSFGGRHYRCPSMQDDTNGDGVLTNEEGAGEYGTMYLSLTTRGDTSPKSGLAMARMPVADASGRIDYRRRIPASQVPAVLVRHLSEVHIVQHGIDANHNDRYDKNALGVSTFATNMGAPGVPEEATDPASCGVLTGAKAPLAPAGGVETGGGSGGSTNLPLAGAGAALLAGSAVLLARSAGGRRPR